MKRLMLALIAICPAVAMAQETTWKAQPRLVKERSAAVCTDTGALGTFTVSGATLTVVVPSGKYTHPVAADGKVDDYFRHPSGNRMRMVGNVNTKQFEVVNTNAGCTYAYTVVN